MKSTHSILFKIGMWTAIALFVIRCFCSFSSLIEEFSLYTVFGYAGEAIGVAAIFIWVYEKWLWRWLSFGVIPILKAHYEGTMKSSCDNKIRDVSLSVKQTFLGISITFKTGESKSTSVCASFENINGEKRLVYTYFNTPHSEHRERSPLHIGTAMLSVENINELTGEYYTDRNTTGDLALKAVNTK